MHFELFYQITAVLVLAGIVSVIVSLLKQPSIIAYILTGLIVGALGYLKFEQEALDALGQIGITLLLFMVGLELDLRQVRRLGKVALFTGLGQIIFTFVIGYLILILLGFSVIASLYISIALTFSSTIIVVKLLAEKKDLQSLYGRICVGFLLVQDFVAMGLLLFLGSSQNSINDPFSSLAGWQFLLTVFVKTLIIVLFLLWLSKKIFPKFIDRFGKSDELLLIFAVAWALGFASLISSPFVGFSLEIGGFLAGLALANSQVHLEISARIRSLRDFFLIIFFIVFGSKLVFVGIGDWFWIAIILSLFVLIGNPLIVMIIMGYMGYKPRTSFFASVTVAQISEFSFVVAALGNRLGHLSDQILGLITLIGIITIAGSSYMILYSDKLYDFLEPILLKFQFKQNNSEKSFSSDLLKNHIILAGANRLGTHLISLNSMAIKTILIVDFDPNIVRYWKQKGFNAICGDISDSYIHDQIGLDSSKLVICTVPDLHDSLTFLKCIKKRTGHKIKTIFMAQNDFESKYLYENGVDYVLSPHFIGGLHLAKILEETNTLSALRKLRKGHLEAIV